MSGMIRTGATPPRRDAPGVGGDLGLAALDLSPSGCPGCRAAAGRPGAGPPVASTTPAAGTPAPARAAKPEAVGGMVKGTTRPAPAPGRRPGPDLQGGLAGRGRADRLAEGAEVPVVGVDADARAGEHGHHGQQTQQHARQSRCDGADRREGDEQAEDQEHRPDRPPRGERHVRQPTDHVVRPRGGPRTLWAEVARTARRRRPPPSAPAPRPGPGSTGSPRRRHRAAPPSAGRRAAGRPAPGATIRSRTGH